VDPTAAAIVAFQNVFRDFRRDPQARVLRVRADAKELPIISRVLRAEEWRPDNSSPFVIFEQAFTREEEAFEAMRQALREHYRVLERALGEEGRPIPSVEPLRLMQEFRSDPLLAIAEEMRCFAAGTGAVLEAPVFCFLPVKVDAVERWELALLRLVPFISRLKAHMVVTDDPVSDRLDVALRRLGDAYESTTFSVNDADAHEAVGRILAALDSGGPIVLGVMPDVDPPPRADKLQSSPEEVQAALTAAGAPPVLTAAQGAELRRHVLAAARAAGVGRTAEAIEEQQLAIDVCGAAGVDLEGSLMTILLASYQLAAGATTDAVESYERAAEHARAVEAWPQVAQAYLALGFVLLQDGQVDAAATTYEQAAGAASHAGAPLLRIEAARMAGECWRRAGLTDRAIVCWRAGVSTGRTASDAEIRLSSLLDMADALLALLREQGRDPEAAEVEREIAELGARFVA
jgi:hypothetical protein